MTRQMRTPAGLLHSRTLALLMVAIMLAGCFPPPAPSQRAASVPTATPSLEISPGKALAPVVVSEAPAIAAAAPLGPEALLDEESSAVLELRDVLSPTGNARLFSGQAQPLDEGGSTNPFPALFPALKTLPTPDWLREGTRVTYYVASATIRKDPEEAGGSGAGYFQFDVVGMEPKNVVESVKYYLENGDKALTPSSVSFIRDPLGSGNYWLNPQVLKDAEKVAFDELAVIKMPATINGKTYQAIRFDYKHNDAEIVWMFEQASGLLLFYSHTMGAEDADRRQLAQMTLVQQRQLKLPWQGKTMPRWVKTGATLKYEGQIETVVGGSPVPSLAYALSVQLTGKGDRSCGYKLSETLSGRSLQTTQRVTGLTQLFDNLWLPAEALPAMKPGQVLDRDPVTGAEIAVGRSSSGTIVVTESGDLYHTTLIFDRTDGTLVALEQQVQIGAGTTTTTARLTKHP